MGLLTTSETPLLPSLLAATSRGDHDGFRELYEATAPKLLGIVLRITQNRAVAEEVLQETYLKIWLNAERFTAEAGHPMAWLATIARNRAIDRVRSERVDRFKDAGDDEGFLDRLPSTGDTDPVMREAIRTCLAELDDDARRCVVLAYCSGYSREELAGSMERPVGTIKTMLHRSVRTLRACLERE